MITGVKDLNPRGFEDRPVGKPKKGEPTDDLFAANLGEMSRTEREVSPGRESPVKSGREGKRSGESDESRSKLKAGVRPGDDPRRAKAKRNDEDEVRVASYDSSQQMKPIRLEDREPRSDSASAPAADGFAKFEEAPSRLNERVRGIRVGGPEVEAGTVDGALLAPQETGPSEAEQQTLDTLSELRLEQADVRRQAMTQFINGMQAEFGVPPQKILEAFSQMSETQLSGSPQASMSAFLQNLELPANQVPRAAEMYSTMIDTTNQAQLSEKLATLGEGVNLEVLSPKQDSLRKLNSALDEMNQTFFMKDAKVMPSAARQQALEGQLKAEQMDARLAQLMRQPPSSIKSSGDQKEFAAMAALGLKGEAVEATALGAGESSAAWTGLEGAGAMSAGLPGLDEGGDLFAGSKGNEGFGSGDGGSSSGFTSGGDASFAVGSDAASAVMGGFAAAELRANEAGSDAADAMKSSKKSSSARGEESLGAVKDGGASTSQVTGQPAPTTNGASSAAGLTPAAMMMDRPQISADDEQANVRELMRQAQTVLKKGGGEMTMELRPEGIGSVKLKVSVDDGQVSIQMLTENDAAKKAIEKGLHELKANLASENLRVETLKVDVGREAQKSMDQSNQDQAREQARQHASEFMGQWREERQAFNQGMNERPGWRTYNKNQDLGRQSMDPAQAVSTSATSLGQRRGDGTKRLDLVV